MYEFCVYVKGERDGMSMSLQQSQDLIKEERERANELKQELSEEQGQSRRLKIDNAEVPFKSIYGLKKFPLN